MTLVISCCLVVAGRTDAQVTGLQAAAAPQTAAADPQVALVTNPRALEVEPPAGYDTAVTGYRVDIFTAGSDTTTATPARTFDVRAEARRQNQRLIRIELGDRLNGLRDGQYVLTVRAVGAGGASPRSRPTPAFAVAGRASEPSPRIEAPTAPPAPRTQAPGGAEPPAAAPPTAAPPAAAPPNATPASVPPADEPNDAKRRMWTIIGISIGAAAFLIPILGR